MYLTSYHVILTSGSYRFSNSSFITYYEIPRNLIIFNTVELTWYFSSNNT